MTVVLSGHDTHHRDIAGGRPLCPAAIYASAFSLTDGEWKIKGFPEFLAI
ncbi:hypothetical protein HMPREF1545_03958 [Oscillibacter sp. KLE 1728]|nr:hypothetical protein HMPREF1545_03958 [Oscillibacter sp. KLE 1728]ERK59288.1 hypothetical protein HMPREF1546_03375 [Oscillibacter sp. KLE 1745]